jgi:FSR family fosmidomycin resistance protein-like MFS transporter
MLGALADWKGLYFVFLICSVLPTIGILTVFLPSLHKAKTKPA